MTLRRVAPALLALLLLAALLLAVRPVPGATAATAPAAPAPAAAVGDLAAKPKVVYFNLGQPEVKPKRMFTAFNSSPYLKKLDWKKWGGRKSVATGIWMSDCASCPGPDRRDAVVRLTRRVTCDNVDYRTYRRAVVTVSEPDEGSTDTTYELPTGCDLAITD